MEGLEFLKDMGDQQKQIIAQNKELADLIKQFLNRPIPAPEMKIDHNELGNQIAQLIGNPADTISKANLELKSTVYDLGETARKIPRSINVKGGFYGFTSATPFFFYLLILSSAVALSSYYYLKNEDLKNYIAITHDTIRKFVKANPKQGEKYFPTF